MLEDFANDLDNTLHTVLNLAELSQREYEVLQARWMHDGKPKLLEQVAKERGVTRERVRHIEAKAFQKLREHRDELEAVFIQAAQLQAEMEKLQARLSLLEAIRWKRTPESQAQRPEGE